MKCLWLLTLGFLTMVVGCGNAETRDIDGTITKDKDGNIYLIEHHYGNTFTVKKIGEGAW